MMLAKLKTSCLSAAEAKLLRLEPYTESEVAAQLHLNPAFAGFRITYFTPEGAPIKDFFRFRYLQTRPSHGFRALAAPPEKPLRYTQPAGSELHVYMPPLLGTHKWREFMPMASEALFITEGELKAACGCVNGFLTLGLGGVFSWMSRRHQQEFLPILEEFAWKDRVVYLCFDSDQTAKPLVQLALSRLTRALLRRGALVHNVLLPPTAQGEKQGMDDFIYAEGEAAFKALLEDKQATQPMAPSAALHQMNEEVTVVWGGGAVGNIIRLEDGQIMRPEQFTRVLYRDRTFLEFRTNSKGEALPPTLKQAADEWLTWPMRGRVQDITYAPGLPTITDDDKYNLYKPTGVQPVRGSIAPWEDLLGRVFEGVPAEHLTWFKRWLAYPLVYPGAKLFTCVLLWSHMGGTGKNLVAEAMFPIYGEGNYGVIRSKHLTSEFNNWIEGKQFIVGDEITLDDKRHTTGDLKSAITSRTVRVNKKGISSYEIPDCVNYYFTSNDPMALTLDQDERRTFVHHATERELGDAYGVRFKRWLEREGGGAALRYYLENELELGDFSPTARPPDTAAKIELIANSRSDIDTWAAALALDAPSVLGRGLAAKYAAGSTPLYDVYTPEDLLKIYDPEDKKRCSMRALGIALDRAGFRKATGNNGRLGNVRSTFWLIQNDNRSRPPIGSTEAARRYAAERPEQFKAGGATNGGRRIQ